MESREVSSAEVRLTVKNIGGISETALRFEPGVSVLTGRNATNRTSLLQAIMAGLGSKQVSLKGAAEEGEVRLNIGDSEYTRTLTRSNGSIGFSGDPYLDGPALADLFAFLLESNEARRTVARGNDLRDIIMRPVDAEAIQSEIRKLKSEREDIEEEIQEREQLKQRLPKLESERSKLQEKIEQKEDELQAKREELEELSTDADEARAEQSELEEKMQDLQQTRSSLENTEFQIKSEQESLESLRSDRDELESEYDELTAKDTADVGQIDSEISRLREQKQQLQSELRNLQSVIQFNEEMLDGTSTDIAAALRGEEDSDTLTDQLLDDSSEVVCWTCGTEVNEEDIEETLNRLRDLRQSKYAEQTDIEDELEELESQKSDIESIRQKRRKAKNKLEEIKSEIDHRESKVEDLTEQKREFESDVEQIQQEIENLEEEDRSEVLDAHREVNELEVERDRLQAEVDDVEQEIEKIESKEKEVESLQNRQQQIKSQLDELRTRIERIEKEAIEEFNDHMDTVLDILDYENLDRIWVERVETTERQGRRKVETTEFRLHIIRSTADGVTYEDEFQHLSESEREVTGLIFALAGYLAHDVYENVPFILLDSLEAIDSERIATLVDYIRDYADYLVVALLPEDASALDQEYQRVTEI
jgi:DNA repair exonuclease SbcCD ATPase subunit